MRYFAAIIPFLFLLILDMLILLSCMFVLGLIVLDMMEAPYPMSYNFIKKVFCV